MSSDLAKAEALFKGFKQKKKDEAEEAANPGLAAERAAAAEQAAAAPEKTRRRVRIRDVSAIRPTPPPLVLERPPDRPSPGDGFRRQISDTIRQLGRAATPSPPIESAPPDDRGQALRASVAPTVVTAFKILVTAPSVQADGPLTFVIEGDDIAQVASDALVRVTEYMADHHPDAAWKMEGLERLPLALSPRS